MNDTTVIWVLYTFVLTPVLFIAYTQMFNGTEPEDKLGATFTKIAIVGMFFLLLGVKVSFLLSYIGGLILVICGAPALFLIVKRMYALN